MGNKKSKKIESKEIKNEKLETEVKGIDKKSLERIEEQFKKYWKYLFSLVFFYVFFYLIWLFLVFSLVRDFLAFQGWCGGAKETWFVVLGAGIIQGLLFCMDGFVSALLKSPFNQMCYAINKAEGISYKKRDSIITKATESNEHCKETLKKFGVLTISGEVIKVILLGAKEAGDKERFGPHWYLINISYLVPIMFAAYRIWQIRKELDKIKKIRVKKSS